MALAPGASASADNGDTHIDAPQLQLFVMGLFFIFGGITSLNDVIIPKLKELFTLNYTQAMLVQFCFFAAYAVIGIPGARLIKKIGYMRGAVAGLLTMMAGCLLFIPASQTATYGVFLLALFVLASGVVIVQVVSNPLISMLGKPATAHSRLTFAQAFNSLGTTVFPIVGSILILGSLATVTADQLSGVELDAYRTAESQASDGLACLDLLKRPRFGFGALCIFLYVGAEVAIGSLIVNYLMQDHVMALPEQDAGKLIGLYWGGAMVGRFIGSAVLRVLSPGKVLASVSVAAIALLIFSTQSTGEVAGYSLLAVGLTNAIMFPTIFTLACEKLGTRAADGSGIINVAIVGGAVVPLLTGIIADVTGSLAIAFTLPMLCYAVIAAFGIYARKPA